MSDVVAVAADYVRGMNDSQAEVEEKYDAFLLYSGMGPMLYITADGRVLVDGRSWDGEDLREATDAEAIQALALGAKMAGISALLGLMPQSRDGKVCPMCSGSRWAEPVPGLGLEILCVLCGGRGWVDQAMLDEAASTGRWPPRAAPS